MSLPSNWELAHISDLADAMFDGPFGSSLKSSDYVKEGVRLARLENIGRLRFRSELKSYVSPEKAAQLARHTLRSEDLLFSSFIDEDTRVCLVPPELDSQIINKADCFCVRVDSSACEAKYLAYRLSARSTYEVLARMVRGVTRPRIGLRDLARLEIELPPLLEQRRIVAKLDALTARIARARAELDRAPVLAASIRLSVLRAAFHWEADALPPGWERKRIDEVGSVQLGRQRSPKDHFGAHMRPYLRAANITWTGWDLSDVKEMNFSPDEFRIFSLQPGDVLLNEGSGSAKEVGKPAVWKGEIEGACFQNTLLRVRPRAYLPDLLRYSLLYIALSGKFIGNTKGVNIVHIGKAGLSKSIIPVPPIEDQPLLLEALDTAFARADRLEAEAARARKLLDRLESAILAKAFRGELVPQDPNDEPASVLLERIRAARAAASKAKRGRRAKV